MTHFKSGNSSGNNGIINNMTIIGNADLSFILLITANVTDEDDGFDYDIFASGFYTNQQTGDITLNGYIYCGDDTTYQELKLGDLIFSSSQDTITEL